MKHITERNKAGMLKTRQNPEGVTRPRRQTQHRRDTAPDDQLRDAFKELVRPECTSLLQGCFLPLLLVHLPRVVWKKSSVLNKDEPARTSDRGREGVNLSLPQSRDDQSHSRIFAVSLSFCLTPLETPRGCGCLPPPISQQSGYLTFNLSPLLWRGSVGALVWQRGCSPGLMRCYC